MSKCPNCGLEVEIGMKFCGECGTQIPQTKECPACHEQLPLSMKFCGNCGYNFNAASSGSGLGVGDKNVISGDVEIDQSRKTVNNVTHTINNFISQDPSRQLVTCCICNRQIVIGDAYVCSKCQKKVCRDHYVLDDLLCLDCSRKLEFESRTSQFMFTGRVLHLKRAKYKSLKDFLSQEMSADWDVRFYKMPEPECIYAIDGSLESRGTIIVYDHDGEELLYENVSKLVENCETATFSLNGLFEDSTDVLKGEEVYYYMGESYAARIDSDITCPIFEREKLTMNSCKKVAFEGRVHDCVDIRYGDVKLFVKENITEFETYPEKDQNEYKELRHAWIETADGRIMAADMTQRDDNEDFDHRGKTSVFNSENGDDDEDEPLEESSCASIDYDAILDACAEYACDDMVFPATGSFIKKWRNIAGVIQEKLDIDVDSDNALAIIDCTVLGSAKNGVLLDKTGIYMLNDWVAKEYTGFVSWEDFASYGNVFKPEMSVVQICNRPKVGINVSGCDLSVKKTIDLFLKIHNIVK